MEKEEIIFSSKAADSRKNIKSLNEGLVYFIITSALIYAPAFRLYPCTCSLFIEGLLEQVATYDKHSLC